MELFLSVEKEGEGRERIGRLNWRWWVHSLLEKVKDQMTEICRWNGSFSSSSLCSAWLGASWIGFTKYSPPIMMTAVHKVHVLCVSYLANLVV